MPDRIHSNDKNTQDDNLNAKEPTEIDQAPKQDINKVALESEREKKVDEDLSKKSDRPVEQP